MAFDIYAAVTDRIIEEMEKGEIPWARPWVCVGADAVNHVTLKPYSLLNQMLLGKAGEYLTFKQVTNEGGKVKKGAKSHMVVFWKPYESAERDADGNVVHEADGKVKMGTYFLLRYYNVFHIDDCEGIKPKIEPKEELVQRINADEKAESIFNGYIKRSGVGFENVQQDRAFYSPLEDKIVLPLLAQFNDVSEYYSTAFHEATHSTGHSSRLNRPIGTSRFGSENYSKEELVAEIGACAILQRIGMETRSSFRNSAAYIQNWLKALKDDKKLIISAAGKAEKAVSLIMGINKEEEEYA